MSQITMSQVTQITQNTQETRETQGPQSYQDFKGNNGKENDFFRKIPQGLTLLQKVKVISYRHKQNYFLNQDPQSIDIEIEESMEDYKSYILPVNTVTEIRLTADRKRKIEKLCWAFNSRHDFAVDFQSKVNDGIFKNMAEAETAATFLFANFSENYRSSQKTCKSEYGNRIWIK